MFVKRNQGDLTVKGYPQPPVSMSGLVEERGVDNPAYADAADYGDIDDKVGLVQ